jgi:TetR/AcrR family transcriptional regulator, tetracycline repressor protein
VRNKDELLNLVIDRVAGELEGSDPEPERWQEQVKDLARKMRAMYHRHPGVARITLGRIPVGPNVMEVNERILAILRAAGLPDRTTAYVVDLFSLYIDDRFDFGLDVLVRGLAATKEPR